MTDEQYVALGDNLAEFIDTFLKGWERYEQAPRTVCPECQFESSEGYQPSHAPGCSRKYILEIEMTAYCQKCRKDIDVPWEPPPHSVLHVDGDPPHHLHPVTREQVK